MGTIRMNDDSVITIIPDGIQQSGNALNIQFIPEEGKTILDYEAFFSDASKTGKIVVVDYTGEDFQVYSRFATLQEIKKQYNAIIERCTDEEGNETSVTGTAICVVLTRLNETEQRLADAEASIAELKDENATLTECILEMSMAVYQ